MNEDKWRLYSKRILTILIIVALGIVIINQTLGYYYKSKFLQGPCGLCEELNPHLKNCFESSSNIIVDSRTNKIIGTNITIDLDNFNPS